MVNVYQMKHNSPWDIYNQLGEVASLLQGLHTEEDLNLIGERITSIQQDVEMTMKENLIQKNGAKIWKSKDNYRAYYFNEAGVKKWLKNKDYKVIETQLVDILKNQLDNPTVREIYDDWIKRKVELEALAKSTVNRYERQYEQTLKVLGEKRVKAVSPDMIEEFLWRIIQEKDLSKKAYSNMCTLLKGIFLYAKKKGIISYSINDILEEVDIPDRLFNKTKKKDNEQVFTDDEKEKLMNYFKDKLLDLKDLGILLMFYTGLRPGEMVALEFADIEDYAINVYKTEVRYKPEGTKKDIYEIQEKTKTLAGERIVQIPEDARWILDKIQALNPDGKYLFEKNGKRIKACSFDSRLRMICNKTDIKEKSLNKIRKTYASTLIDEGVSDSVIMAQMGHTDILTTRNYYYKNQKGKKQIVSMLDSAFENSALKKVSQV